MGKKKKKKKKKRAGGPPPAVPGKAWEKAATALAAAASQPGVHAAIDDVDTLMHLASLRKAEAELSRAQHDLPDAYATHAAAHALSLPIGRAQAPPPTSLTANAATSTVGGAAAAPPAPSSQITLDSPDLPSDATAAVSVHACFRDWLQDNGITDESYEIRASKVEGAGNGLFIKGAGDVGVAKGTVVVRVPSRVMLSSLHVHTPSVSGGHGGDIAGGGSVVGEAAGGGDVNGSHSAGLQWMFRQSHILRRQPSIQLALVLLHECFKGRGSFWFWYIATFPTSFASTLPLWWSVNKLSCLAGQSASLRSAARGIVSFARYYCHVDQLLATLAAQQDTIGASSTMPFPRTFFTLKNFRWAMSIVMTRQNPVPFKNKSGEISGRVLALVPVMDMANHDPTLDHGTFYDDETDEICVAASSLLHGGDELRMYYGDRTNQEFLVHCGFVTENNRHDKTTVLLSAHSGGDPLYKLRVAVLRQQGIVGRPRNNDNNGQDDNDVSSRSAPCTQFELDIFQGGVPSHELIVFCKNMLLSKGELGSMLRAGATPGAPGADNVGALAAALAVQPLDGDADICSRVEARSARVATYLMGRLEEVKRSRAQTTAVVRSAWPAAGGSEAIPPLAAKKLLQDQRLVELAVAWCRQQGGVEARVPHSA